MKRPLGIWLCGLLLAGGSAAVSTHLLRCGETGWWLYKWLLASGAVMFALGLLTTWRKGHTGRLRLRSGLCLSCGYDLRATPGRCPECGAATDAPASG